MIFYLNQEKMDLKLPRHELFFHLKHLFSKEVVCEMYRLEAVDDYHRGFFAKTEENLNLLKKKFPTNDCELLKDFFYVIRPVISQAMLLNDKLCDFFYKISIHLSRKKTEIVCFTQNNGPLFAHVKNDPPDACFFSSTTLEAQGEFRLGFFFYSPYAKSHFTPTLKNPHALFPDTSNKFFWVRLQTYPFENFLSLKKHLGKPFPIGGIRNVG